MSTEKTSTTTHKKTVYIMTKTITVPDPYGHGMTFSEGEDVWVTNVFSSGNARVCIGQGDYIDIPKDTWKKVIRTTTTVTTTVDEDA